MHCSIENCRKVACSIVDRHVAGILSLCVVEVGLTSETTGHGMLWKCSWRGLTTRTMHVRFSDMTDRTQRELQIEGAP